VVFCSTSPPRSPSPSKERGKKKKEGLAPLYAVYSPLEGGVLKSLSVSLYEGERLTFPPLKKGD